MNWKCGLAMATALAVGGGVRAAGPGASRPAQASSDQAPAWQAQLAARLPLWTAATLEAPQKASAVAAIHGIVEAIYDPLDVQGPSGDLEVRLRLKEIPADLLEMARLKKVLASLPPGRRKELLAYYAADQRHFDAIFDIAVYFPQMMEQQGVAALQRAVPTMEAGPAGEAAIIACLLYGGQPLMRSAARLVYGSDLRSPELVDALTYSVAGPISGGVWPDPAREKINWVMGEAWLPCLAVLEDIGGRSQGPALLGALLKPKPVTQRTHAVDMALAGALIAMGDRRMVQPLLDEIQRRSSRPTSRPVAGAIDIQDVDPLIECAFGLCGLGHATSKVEVRLHVTDMMVFKRPKDRDDAIARLRQWWDKKKDSYSTTQPYVPADTDRLPRQSRLIAAAAQGAGGGKFDADEARALAAQVRDVCQAAVKDLGHDRLARRQAAQRLLYEVFETYLNVLTACGDRPESAELAAALMDRALAESRFQAAKDGMPKDLREKLTRCRKAVPEAFDQVFALERVRGLVGIRKLAYLGDDERAAAEPLLVYALVNRSYETMSVAVETAMLGKYKSDGVVDALSDIMLSNVHGFFMWLQGCNGAMSWPQMEALEALTAIDTPRALSVMVNDMVTGRNYDENRRASVTDALIELGDKRVVPALVAFLDPRGAGISGKPLPNAKKFLVGPRDFALAAVVKLTGQDVADYRMAVIESALGMGAIPLRMYGFEKDDDRVWAFEKIRQWWGANKDTPPYSEFKPLPAAPKVTGGQPPMPIIDFSSDGLEQ